MDSRKKRKIAHTESAEDTEKSHMSNFRSYVEKRGTFSSLKL
jgi:hypothetical protein